MPVGEICDAQTEQLNCGCCDAVIFDCDLVKGHSGLHAAESRSYTTVMLTVMWGDE